MRVCGVGCYGNTERESRLSVSAIDFSVQTTASTSAVVCSPYAVLTKSLSSPTRLRHPPPAQCKSV
jgi:hypothetical protein